MCSSRSETSPRQLCIERRGGLLCGRVACYKTDCSHDLKFSRLLLRSYIPPCTKDALHHFNIHTRWRPPIRTQSRFAPYLSYYRQYCVSHSSLPHTPATRRRSTEPFRARSPSPRSFQMRIFRYDLSILPRAERKNSPSRGFKLGSGHCDRSDGALSSRNTPPETYQGISASLR